MGVDVAKKTKQKKKVFWKLISYFNRFPLDVVVKQVVISLEHEQV